METSTSSSPSVHEKKDQETSTVYPSTIEPLTGGRDDATDGDVRKVTGFCWFLICAALYLSASMYGLDTTIAADVQGAVIETFGEVSQLAWIGAGFPLGSVAVILPYGFLYTTFNMKYLYIAGIILFQAGSALCGAAPTMNALIVGRVFAGAGGTGIYLGGLNHFSALTMRQERGIYLTGTGFVWGLGAILGPVVGGGFSDSSATWRWGFYINLIIGAITAPVYLFYLPPIHPAAGKPLRDRLLRLDYLGFVLSAAAWVTFTMGFISAGGVWAWHEGRTIALLVVFAVLLVLYALQQYLCLFTTTATRSFPGHLLRSRTQILLYITTTCANTGMFFTAYYIPIYFQFTQNDSSLMAAVRLLPYLLVTITCNLATGWALPKVQYYMPLCLISGALMTLASGLFVGLLSPDTPTAHIYGFTILMAIGTGITMQLGYAVASLKVPASDIFSAINLQNVAQIGATVLCLVIAGQVFQSTAVRNLTSVLAGRGFSETEIHGAVAGTQSALFESLRGDVRDAAVGAITAAMRRAFVVPLVAGGVGLFSSLLMKRERLLK
ncbi:major facilitator superfamily domain-containing protein [Aspergillus candidus]|uniref:Major facilitator superfamily domain-containing protein n=1 Tax=Aspergillus candidus TaxID=41067 RepID=A0A2I2F6K5_ASPCN|nr:major facilitator superfamily domain-containing protein [Aspergillus candidus]PLB36279.1 major facilitator superfamily domain-containing protein [Aspergillus candidus]